VTRSALEMRGLRSAAELAVGRPHGDRLRYIGGCRCAECRAANSRYECERARARKAGDWNGVVSAERARAHLRQLARKGVGRRAVQAATDLPESILHEIRHGRRPRIRARTERKILAVTPAVRADHSYVSAGRLWQRLNQLLEEGFSKSFLARQLGYVGPGLQFSRTRVTAKSDARVERLHRRLTT